MNIALGQSGIVLGLLGALGGFLTLGLGLLRGRASLVRAGQGYIWLVAAGAVVATFAMQRALLTHDFSLAYVASNDSTFTPLVYRVTAMWSALAGSILLWALILAGYLVAMWIRYRDRRDEPFVLWAKFVGYVVAAFFFGLMLIASNPFARVDGAVPTQGPGPDPLLQDRLLVAFHPPMLYLGLVGFTVPFCLAVASLVTGRTSQDWLAESRRWALWAWACLTAGLVLGMWWSYQVLGWGGYWSWDPVENSALLPWLTGTAFLHSAMVQQQRAMLKVWNLALVLATFCLTVLGTFFTRSGVLESVHSFTNDGGVGPALLGFFALVTAASIALLAWRGDRLRSRGEAVRALSREGAFLANNLLFASFAVVVLIGTVFPLIVEAVNGSAITVGGPFFNTMTTPIMMCLLFMMAVAPVLPWRRAAAEVLRHRLLWPAGGAAAVAVVSVAAGVRGLWPLVAFTLAAFAGTSALRQLVLMVRRAGLRALPGRSGGGMVVHLGVVAVAVAITASQAYQQEGSLAMRPGHTYTYDGHTLVYRGSRTVQSPGATSLVATVVLDGHAYHPGLKQFTLSNEAVPNPAVKSSPTEDVYLSLSSVPSRPGQPLGLSVYVKPLMIWLWVGGMVMVIGAVLSLAPLARRRRQGGDVAPEATEVLLQLPPEPAQPVGAAR